MGLARFKTITTALNQPRIKVTLLLNIASEKRRLKECEPMLTLLGDRQRYCDGISRRSFLNIGGLAMGGMTLGLPGLLRAEAKAGVAETRSFCWRSRSHSTG